MRVLTVASALVESTLFEAEKKLHKLYMIWKTTVKPVGKKEKSINLLAGKVWYNCCDIIKTSNNLTLSSKIPHSRVLFILHSFAVNFLYIS